MCSMEALGLSLPALCHHYRNYESIYDRQVEVLRTLGFYVTFTCVKKM